VIIGYLPACEKYLKFLNAALLNRFYMKEPRILEPSNQWFLYIEDNFNEGLGID